MRGNFTNHPKGRKLSEEAKHKIGSANSKNIGERSSQWKGGKFKKNGYLYVMVRNNPNIDRNGYVLEHRLKIEQAIGRYLEIGSEVHHIDKNRLNNDISNLMAFRNKKAHRNFEEGNEIDINDVIYDGRKNGSINSRKRS